MVTLTGRRFFGRTKKPGGLDTVDIAFEFGVGLWSGLSFANQKTTVNFLLSLRQTRCPQSRKEGF